MSILKHFDSEICHMKHRGQLLEQAVRLKFRSHSAAAKALGVSRSTLYRYFEQDKLGDDLLIKMGQKMGYDFTKEDKSLGRNFLEDPVENYVSKFLEKTTQESVMMMVTIDGLESSLKSTIKKLTAINNLMQEQNFQSKT